MEINHLILNVDPETINKMLIFSDDFAFEAAQSKGGPHPFSGIITYAGKISERYVGGTENIPGGPYRVLIPPEVIRRKIKELSGKTVYASAELVSHSHAKVVGEFTDTWCELAQTSDGASVLAAKASGVLFKDREPEFAAQIIELAREGRLGFSYDIKDVKFTLEDIYGEKICVVTDFKWRGATILLREAGAYANTKLAAQKHNGGEDVNIKEEIRSILKEELDAFKKDAISPMMEEVESSIAEVKAATEANAAKLTAMEQKENSSASDDETQQAGAGQDKVETQQAGAGQGTMNTRPGLRAGAPERVKISDLIDGIAAGISEAIKPMVDKQDEILNAIKEAPKAGNDDDDPKRRRHTLTAEEVQVISKYGGDDDVEVTVESLSAACAAVEQDDTLTKEEKLSIIQKLSGAKRRLLKGQLRA